MVTVHEELEIKYDAPDDFELPSLTGLLAGAAGSTPLVEGEAVRHRLQATYFDTADHRLRQARLTLRRRTGGTDAGWHLKVPGEAGARREIRLPPGRTASSVPAALRELVWARTRGADLVPVARLTTVRTVRQVLDPAGQAMVEVADDQVSAERLPVLTAGGDGAQPAELSWRELEVEVVAGDPELLHAIDQRLRDLGLRVAKSSSKLARVMDEVPVPSVPPPPPVAARSRAGDVVMHYLREQVEQILAHDLLVRLDAPDSVHKMRVATRRLRSALKTFRPVFDPVEVRPLRDELRWLAGELGAARDAEVLRARLLSSLVDDGDQPDAGPVAASLDGQLSQAAVESRDQLLKTLNSTRHRRLLDALAVFVQTPPFSDRAQRKAAKALPRRVARTFANLRGLVTDAAGAGSVDERDHLLHEARKAAKQARYAGEAVAEVFGPDAATFAKAMEAVQEELGEHQDSVVMREKLRTLALAETEPGAAFAHGRLYAREEVRGEEAVERFEATWRSSSKKSLRRWLS